jgi:hypothetical protein
MKDYLEKAYELLQAAYDANFEIDEDGDTYCKDDKLRRKLNSIMDRLRSLL